MSSIPQHQGHHHHLSAITVFASSAPSKLDPVVDTNFAWTESREDWAKVSQGKDEEPSKWWFEAGLKHSKNETAGMYSRSSVFSAAFNGTGGDDESGATGVRASFGGALVVLAAAALVM
jgi:hypothetical protein